MKTIDRMIFAAAAVLACAALANPAVAAEDSPDQTQASVQASSPTSSSTNNGQRDAQGVIAAWPDNTRTAAQALIEKYGSPDGVLDTALIWNDKAPWKKVAVFRDAVHNSYPVAHEEFIEDEISFKVPESKVAALARFDHSLVVNQTRGTLASQGDSEKNNFLALNLANEIVTGSRSVASARSFMKKTVEESMAGKSSPYTESLMFTPPATSPSQDVEPATQP